MGSYYYVPLVSCCPPPRKVNFTDAAFHIDYRSGSTRIGIRTGFVDEKPVDGRTVVVDTCTGTDLLEDMIQTTYYPKGALLFVNPYIAGEWKYFGLGLGIGIGRDTRRWWGNPVLLKFPTAHLRIGPKDIFYFSAHLLEDYPLYSGGGIIRVGFGTKLHPKTRLWVGTGIVGIDFFETAYAHFPIISLEQKIGENCFMNIKSGAIYGKWDFSLSLGLTYRFSHARER